MKAITITKNCARRMAVNSSFLSSAKCRAKGKNGIFHIVDSLGYVQIDTISVIERAHHHTLWNRQDDYRHDHLDSLISKDRLLFEYWGHAASILPMKDFRFYLPYMEKCRNPASGWAKRREEKCWHIIEEAYNRIKEEGPLGARDFKADPGSKSNGWWDWKPAKIALEVLFSQGRLMVSGRKGFQKSYDLVERVLPGDVNREYPADIEAGSFFVRQALLSYGIATKKEIFDHIYSADKKHMEIALLNMTTSGEVIPVSIKSLEKEKYFMLEDQADRLLKLKKQVSRLRFLSPFDNLVIQRERIERIFDFSYKLECYVPEAKRQYGYFSLPLLWSDQLIGRMDSKADRKNKTFIIKNMLFEENFKDRKNLFPDMDDALENFMSVNGCRTLVVEKADSEIFARYC